jgi:hypothetical protein
MKNLPSQHAHKLKDAFEAPLLKQIELQSIMSFNKKSGQNFRRKMCHTSKD